MKTVPFVRPTADRGAFTILELLMVIAIIGVLSAMGIAAVRGLTDAKKSGIATQQLVDDLKLARNRAVTERTTVYVVFVPTNFASLTLSLPTNPPPSAIDNIQLRRDERLVEQLLDSKYTSYAMFSWRGVGEQPGVRRPRYLTAWRSLPQGSFIPPHEFATAPAGPDPSSPNWWQNYSGGDRPLPYDYFPFPSENSNGALPLPYIAFNHQGQLVQPRYLGYPLDAQLDEALHVGYGSIFYARDGSTGKLNNEYLNGNWMPADILETPASNSTNVFVRVNWLTGRAELEKPRILD